MRNITENLIKDYWVRRVVPNNGELRVRVAAHGRVKYRTPYTSGPGATFMYLTQDDFLNEIEPTAHSIFDKYMSQRAIYSPTGEKDKSGKEKWAITGYDEVESVALGLQARMAAVKASHMAADGFWIANESHEENNKDFDILNSWKDYVGLNTAYMEATISAFKTGDAAILLYQGDDNSIHYKVFSYLYGDTLYPDIDEYGEPMLYRQYELKGKMAVDIYTTKTHETWVRIDEELESDASWLDKFKKWISISKDERSEDGFRLVRRKDAQAGNDILQVVYFRVPDIPSGVAESSIQQLEKACSYISEEVKSSAFPILFLKSEKIVSLPPSKLNGKTIGVKGSSETVKNSDAKFLAPPDASDIATLNVNTLMDNITRSTLSVFIEPDILKAGADSSTTIKILYAPEIQWCQNMWIHFYKPLKQLMEVFTRLVGKVEGRPTDFAKIKTSIGQNIWIPQNEAERVKIELDQVYARTKSRRAAMVDIGNKHINDEEVIKQEWEYELQIKSEIPAKVKAEYGTSSATEDDDENSTEKNDLDTITNQASGKTIRKDN